MPSNADSSSFYAGQSRALEDMIGIKYVLFARLWSEGERAQWRLEASSPFDVGKRLMVLGRAHL